MKMKNVKNFVEDHKLELIGFVIGYGIWFGIDRFRSIKNKGSEKMPGFTIEGGLTIADIGKLGEEYMKHDPELTKDTKILEVGNFVFD